MSSANAELFDDSEANPFDVEQYVERLAWRSGAASENSFDPQVLYDEFSAHIQELRLLDQKLQKKSQRLESDLRKEGKKHAERIQELQRSQQQAFQSFQDLEERISTVAARVVHLGEQLEGVNTPREHAADAQKLMGYFSEFLDDNLTSDVLLNSHRLNETADIIRKLHLIAQELQDSQFDDVKMRIMEKYKHVERELLLKFREAGERNDIEDMQLMAETLSRYQNYQMCVDAYIEESVEQLALDEDIFAKIKELIEQKSPQITKVFNSPEQVIGKLIQSCYETQLQEYIRYRLVPMKRTNTELYLTETYKMFQKTTELSESLSKYRPGSDSTFTKKLQKSIFRDFTDSYIKDEEDFVKSRCKDLLDRYYERRGHEKRSQITSKVGSIFSSEVKKIEILISEELAASILQETHSAFRRCGHLSPSSGNDAASNALKIFSMLIEYLMKQHLQYAVDLALSQAPPSEPKSEPDLSLYLMVQEANTVWHLFEKQFNDDLLPLTAQSPKHAEAVQQRKQIKDTMENSLDSGLDKVITSTIGYCKYLLRSEQRKTDFLSDELASQATAACLHVVEYLHRVITHMKSNLDGENIDIVLGQFGSRLHNLIFEHLQGFQYSSMGGMLAICDIKEYRTAAKALNAISVDHEFDTLHALCNLLVAVPENLRQVCTGDQLANIDKNILHNFVKRRTDYKTSNLEKLFS